MQMLLKNCRAEKLFRFWGTRAETFLGEALKSSFVTCSGTKRRNVVRRRGSELFRQLVNPSPAEMLRARACLRSSWLQQLKRQRHHQQLPLVARATTPNSSSNLNPSTVSSSSSSSSFSTAASSEDAAPRHVMTKMSFAEWLAENKADLKPPVANKLIYEDALKVMVVGGPNQRSDYHLQRGEELFWQLEGTAVVNIVQNANEKRPVEIPAGYVWLLPSSVPHNPTREANSIGFVFERERCLAEIDAVQWYVALACLKQK